MENVERQPKAEGRSEEGEFIEMKREHSKAEDNGNDRDVDALIEILDGCVMSGDSRIKLDVVENRTQGTERRYHHGRCDIGSPWACGTAFDVLEE